MWSPKLYILLVETWSVYAIPIDIDSDETLRNTRYHGLNI